VSSDKPVVEREIFISASPETLFRFLIDPLLMAQWIGAFHRLEPHPGGRFQIELSPGNVARGVFTDVTPPKRVAFTWGWQTQDPTLALVSPGESLVEIELIRKEGGTLLRLRHSRLPETAAKTHDERWGVYLDALQIAAGKRDRDEARH
jgi:uncharacterized protein YndB with AHSA1/START domain